MEWPESGCAFFSGVVGKWFCVVAFIFNGVFELVVAVFIGWSVWRFIFNGTLPGWRSMEHLMCLFSFASVRVQQEQLM